MASLLPYAFDDADLGRVPRRTAPSVPASLALHAGTGTVFVHPDVAGGRQIWTAYWERSSGFGAKPDEPTGILEEGPSWERVEEAVAWGRARTPRVVVVDASGTTAWAGGGDRPVGIEKDWLQ